MPVSSRLAPAASRHLAELSTYAAITVADIRRWSGAGTVGGTAVEAALMQGAVDALAETVLRMQAVLRLPAEAVAAVAQIESGFAGLVAMKEAAAANGINLGPARHPCRLCGDRGGDTVTPADPCPMCGKERGE